MNCKDVQSILFDFHDGSLPEKDREAVENHLSACVSCREFLEDEARFAEMYRAAFAERKRAHRFQADAIRFPSSENQADPGLPTAKRKRFLRVFVPISMGAALVLVSILVFRPFRHAKDPHDLKASFVSDDLPDPFRDWIEKRMIITIEDKATGSLERIETNRHGIVARSTETRGNR
jgi:anti-sigma factor RsiW